MSVTVNMSERQLRLSIFRLALGLTGLIALVATVLSFVIGGGQSLALNALFVCVAFAMVTNGVLALTRVVDWFEARKQRNG